MKWLETPAGRLVPLLASVLSLVVVLLGEPECAAALARLGVPVAL